METGHGWNDELTQLIDREGITYARQNFRVSLLEYRPARTDDAVIISREIFWKGSSISGAIWLQQKLADSSCLTRGKKHGYFGGRGRVNSFSREVSSF
jgi:hypothetical protein